jgi:hypothetical protein
LSPTEKGINLKENKNDRVTVMQNLVNLKKNYHLLCLKFVALITCLEVENKKGFFGQNRWRFSRKAKSLIVVAIIIVMLISILSFLPKQSESISLPKNTDTPTASPSSTATPITTTQPPPSVTYPAQVIWQDPNMQSNPSGLPKSPGVIKSAQTMNSTVWLNVASNAWAYFQPDVGVVPKTGLPTSGYGAPCFTDWDLGVYIQAVMDAQNLNLTQPDGAWGSSARIEKVITFLETRPLNNTTHYPFWFYQSSDGQDWHKNSDLATEPVDVVDTGRLFVALNNLRVFNSSLISRINNIVLYGRSDYAALVPSIKTDGLTSTSIYAYYIYSGFASFWPDILGSIPSTIMNNIFSAGNVSVDGVSLPAASITGDPLICSVFELNNNDSRLMALTNQVYLAHQAHYNATQGQYRAFSEGPALSGDWQYEWVVLPDNRSWVVLNGTGQVLNLNPLIYTKIAISFLAIYNSSFAKDLSVHVEDSIPAPIDGYCEGVDEAGAVFDGVGLNTNGLILDAASYAVFNSPQNI